MQVIYINSANYTAWETRWRCLEGLPDLFLQKEAVFLDEMLDLNPKNYQLWNYRRRFALKRGKVFEEEVRSYTSYRSCVMASVCTCKPEYTSIEQILSFIGRKTRGKAGCLRGQAEASVHHKNLMPACLRCQEFLYSGRCLADDAKNYHAWAHRAAIADAFNAWERELPIITKMLSEDMRNNSAWNHRFLTLQRLLERSSSTLAVPQAIPLLPAGSFVVLFFRGGVSVGCSC